MGGTQVSGGGCLASFRFLVLGPLFWGLGLAYNYWVAILFGGWGVNLSREFDYTKTPWPWFGGKSKAAPVVWAALGDVTHYVEPFFGGGAVLLRRPHEANRTYYSETVNDLDGFLVNAWRSIRLSPGATAGAASWPVAEADLMARHLRLLRWRKENDLERLMADPDWHDPVMGGWWIWGLCCWIGSGWCAGQGPWRVGDDGKVVNVPRSKAGVWRQLPHLTSNGGGVNAPQLREPGVGEEAGDGFEYHPITMPKLREWFDFLSARLRHVRILNGDWKRAVTTGAAFTLAVRQGKGPCGVFLDPPYAATAGRDMGLYTEESGAVAHDAADWAIANGDNPKFRIVFAGFEGEHGAKFADAGWREVEWFKAGPLRGGMGHLKKEGTHQQHRERLWLSPHCLGLEVGSAVDSGSAVPVQASLFS
jgi:DNA adenine methylase